MSLDKEFKFAEGQLQKLLLEAESQRVKYEAENLDLRRGFEASRVKMANEISTLSKSGIFVDRLYAKHYELQIISWQFQVLINRGENKNWKFLRLMNRRFQRLYLWLILFQTYLVINIFVLFICEAAQLKSLEKFQLEREGIRIEMESTLEELDQLKTTHRAELVATERTQLMHLNRWEEEGEITLHYCHTADYFV